MTNLKIALEIFSKTKVILDFILSSLDLSERVLRKIIRMVTE